MLQRLAGVVEIFDQKNPRGMLHELLRSRGFLLERLGREPRPVELGVFWGSSNFRSKYSLPCTVMWQPLAHARRLGRTADSARLLARVRQLLDEEKQKEAETGQYRVVAAPAGR